MCVCVCVCVPLCVCVNMYAGGLVEDDVAVAEDDVAVAEDDVPGVYVVRLQRVSHMTPLHASLFRRRPC